MILLRVYRVHSLCKQKVNYDGLVGYLQNSYAVMIKNKSLAVSAMTGVGQSKECTWCLRWKYVRHHFCYFGQKYLVDL